MKGITDVSFAQGFLLEDHPLNERLLHQAIELAKSCDVAVIFAGLPESFETEFYESTDSGGCEGSEKYGCCSS